MRCMSILLSTIIVAVAQAQSYQAVATAEQIMEGVQKPAMDSLAAMLKAGGPKDDKEWHLAKRQAAVLAETSPLLLMGTRPLDQDIWVKSSERLNQAAVASLKAAETKDLAAWKTSLANMGAACKSCHNVHKKKKTAAATQ